MTTAAEKVRARVQVNRAVAAGTLTRPKACGRCGASGRIHGHHPDYDKPLEVEWLCPACHRREHSTLCDPVRISVHIPVWVHAKLRAAAAAHGTSVSEEIRQALREFADSREADAEEAA